jgi:hypothetical protein
VEDAFSLREEFKCQSPNDRVHELLEIASLRAGVFEKIDFSKFVNYLRD